MFKLPLFVVAVIVAAGAFWVTMLTSPPQTEAAQPYATIDVNELMKGKEVPMGDPADAF